MGGGWKKAGKSMAEKLVQIPVGQAQALQAGGVMLQFGVSQGGPFQIDVGTGGET